MAGLLRSAFLTDNSSEVQQLLVLAAGLALLAFLFNNRRQSKLPPGPPGLPVVGNLGIFVTSKHPQREIHRLAKQYGPLMSVRLGSKAVILACSAQMAKEVLKTVDGEFAHRPNATIKNSLFYGEDTLGFASYGPRWRNNRKIATMELLTVRRIQQFEELRVEEVCRLARSLLEASRSSDPVVNMHQKMVYTVGNMLTRTLMGMRLFPLDKYEQSEHKDDVAAELKEAIEGSIFFLTVQLIGDWIPYLSFLDRIMNYKAKMQQIHKQLDVLMDEILEERRRQRQQYSESDDKPPTTDFLDILLSMPGHDGAEKLEDSTIKGLITDMLVAGTDTTSVTVEWGLAELVHNPAVMRKLQTELDSVVGRDRLVAESDLPNLPYLRAVVKEVFRHHPSGPMTLPHLTQQECTVAGYRIPAGTVAFVNLWGISHSEEAWEDPLRFWPERFVGRDDVDVRGQHFDLLTFSAGRRSCPGLNFATAVVHYALASLAHRFDWLMPYGQDPQHLDMEEVCAGSLMKAKPLELVPVPRLPRHLY